MIATPLQAYNSDGIYGLQYQSWSSWGLLQLAPQPGQVVAAPLPAVIYSYSTEARIG